jgi:sigma-B regulation protein RsbQ
LDILRRSNVNFSGDHGSPLVFAHGFGCDQQMWRFVAPVFTATHRVVLFDHIGCGKSDASAWSEQRHASLDGYAQDLVDILEAADLRDATLVGHSVSAMIAMLAAARVPERVARLVMVCPSPRYLNDPPDYVGGFDRADIDSLLDMMENNMLGWASFLAPVVMGAESTPGLTSELQESFCANDPYITRRFAMATFLADNRADLAACRTPCLILQCAEDAVAPPEVGQFVHRGIAGSSLVTLEGTGHCPHLTHPQQTRDAIRTWLAR